VPGELPPGLERLWGLGQRPEREPRPGLNVDRIVRAAIELADADGLAAVSMARVAERLGFTTMSLYRHVRSKDELLVLMTETAVGPPPPLDPGAEPGWRPGLERWCRDLLAAIQRHPWHLEIPLTGPPSTPSAIAWFERGLQALADTPLSEPEKAAVMLLLNGQVFWEARLSAELATGGPEGAFLDAVVDAERFPAVRRALDASIFEDESRDDDFAWGLERVLDGIERLIEQRG
jgi:AcrR family transcriptional regulator